MGWWMLKGQANPMETLVQDMLQGSRRALARLLTHIENGQADEALKALHPHTGKAWVIGVTGAPGTGKSSLVNTLTKGLRAQDKTVAIIAVDPTSPFSGGAILGDRIRMRELSGDSGVFIRSMATRGSLGGLSRATRDAVRAMDSAGFDYVIVETVGAGQSEVDIVRTADTTLVVEAPGLGDDVQAIKAGILEIADILVVNKADRVGASQTVRALRAMLELGHPSAKEHLVAHHGQMMTVSNHTPPAQGAFWNVPVVQTVAIDNKGIDELITAIQSHRTFLAESGTTIARKTRFIELELRERLQEALIQRLTQVVPAETFKDIIEAVQTKQIDPQSAVVKLLEITYNQP